MLLGGIRVNTTVAFLEPSSSGRRRLLAVTAQQAADAFAAAMNSDAARNAVYPPTVAPRASGEQAYGQSTAQGVNTVSGQPSGSVVVKPLTVESCNVGDACSAFGAGCSCVLPKSCVIPQGATDGTCQVCGAAGSGPGLLCTPRHFARLRVQQSPCRCKMHPAAHHGNCQFLTSAPPCCLPLPPQFPVCPASEIGSPLSANAKCGGSGQTCTCPATPAGITCEDESTTNTQNICQASAHPTGLLGGPAGLLAGPAAVATSPPASAAQRPHAHCRVLAARSHGAPAKSQIYAAAASSG